MTKEDVSSPTVSTEAVLLTALIDALEERCVVICDIPNAFMQSDIGTKPGESRTALVLRGVIVEMLLKIDPDLCTPFVKCKANGEKMLHLVVNKAQCGLLESPTPWHQKFKSDLEDQGFELNPCD